MHSPSDFTPAALGIDERREGRLPLHLPAFLITPGDCRHSILVTDISTLGCRIAGPVRVQVGRYLGIQIPGLAAYSGWVAWQTREEFGLDFSNPLPAALVAHITRLGLADAPDEPSPPEG